MTEQTPASYPDGRGGRKVNDLPQPDTWRDMPLVPPAPDLPPTLPEKWAYELRDLYGVWYGNLTRNKTRFAYYDGRNRLKDFGISTPPELLDVETVVGWPNKAVMALATRSRLDGFTAGSEELQARLDGMARRSNLHVKYRQTVEAEGVYGCSFATVGMTRDGARIDMHDAEHAAARWDDATGRTAYGMTVSLDSAGLTGLTLYSDDANVYVWLDPATLAWRWEAAPHSMGRSLMEGFAYRPTQRKPYGQSRITRAVMSITDSAVRVALGGDISYQFAVSPQKFLLGADRDALKGKTKWEAYIGNIMGVSYNGVDGVMPQFGQLQQASMQQTVDYMRLLAARFSGETNVPISQLGVIHDNPSSAEAIYAASEPLIIECQDLNDNSRETLRALAQMCMAAEQGVPLAELPDEWRDFTPNFANPAMPSIVSTADAAVKIAAAVPGFAGTEAFWKMLGLPEDTRREVRAELTEATADAMLAQLFGTDLTAAAATEGAENG